MNNVVFAVPVAPGGAMDMETQPLVKPIVERVPVEGEGERVAINLVPLVKATFQTLGSAILKTSVSTALLASNTVLSLLLVAHKISSFTVIGSRLIGGLSQPLYSLNAKLSQYGFEVFNRQATALNEENKKIVGFAKNAFSVKGCQVVLSSHHYKNLAYETFKGMMAIVAVISNIFTMAISLLAKALIPVCCIGNCIEDGCFLGRDGLYESNHTLTTQYFPLLSPLSRFLYNSGIAVSCNNRNRDYL